VADEEEASDVFGLWVAPEVRNTGVAWQLVEAAAQQAVRDGSTRLYYWVSTENGRAVAFATNFGFRVTSQRRTARVSHSEFGDQEVAFVLSLASDSGVPNPTGPRIQAQPGPR
jgi:ribosomal protein S18 acetylase RimI-like enzyme